MQPLLHAGSRVVVDGRPICVECGRGVEPTGPDRWRHIRPGEGPPRRSKWLSPTLAELRACGTYERFAATYPWAVRPEGGGQRASTEGQWREAVARLERYEERLRALGTACALGPGENPYLELVELLAAEPPVPEDPLDELVEARQPRYWGLPYGLAQLLDLSERRRELVARFAWAIPVEAALDALARHAPFVDCCAGTGYWPALLLARGVDAIAYDLAPPAAELRWAEVREGTAVDAARRHADRTLLLGWPPYDDDEASWAPLRAYCGDVVAFVGERDGAAGSVRFHRELALNWTAVEEVELVRWPGLQDRLTVYRRNAVRRPHTLRDRCPECGRFRPAGSIGRCDACLEARPPALALRVGRHRIEYAAETLASLPPALRRALEASPARIR